jgi:hypothetical protein
MSKTSLVPVLMTPVLLAALLFTSQSSFADDNEQANSESSKRRGPPPAAFTACEGKSAGESAQVETRRGKTLTGTCEVLGGKNAGKLVLRPDNMKEKGQQSGKRRTPPEAAFTACEGKSSGETSQFESRRGEILTGTCEALGEEMNGKLVLRPERFRK